MENKPRVLVVDDAPMNLRLLSGVLRNFCRVSVATGGPEALALARSQHPDLILLDVMMPEMDGFEVCRQLKADTATSAIPILFISALAETEEQTKGLALGAAGFLAKPIDPEQVESKIQALLNRAETEPDAAP